MSSTITKCNCCPDCKEDGYVEVIGGVEQIKGTKHCHDFDDQQYCKLQIANTICNDSFSCHMVRQGEIYICKTHGDKYKLVRLLK